MARTLVFTQVTDDRFKSDIPILDTLEERSKAIVEKLEKAGCTVRTSQTRTLKWDPPENNTQCRKDFFVTKSRAITWENVYGIINSVKPTHYKLT